MVGKRTVVVKIAPAAEPEISMAYPKPRLA